MQQILEVEQLLKNMKFMGLTNPYIILTKYEIKSYAVTDIILESLWCPLLRYSKITLVKIPKSKKNSAMILLKLWLEWLSLLIFQKKKI